MIEQTREERVEREREREKGIKGTYGNEAKVSDADWRGGERRIVDWGGHGWRGEGGGGGRAAAAARTRRE